MTMETNPSSVCIGYITEKAAARLQDPETRKYRDEPAMLWTINEPPSRAIIPVFLGMAPSVPDMQFPTDMHGLMTQIKDTLVSLTESTKLNSACTWMRSDFKNGCRCNSDCSSVAPYRAGVATIALIEQVLAKDPAEKPATDVLRWEDSDGIKHTVSTDAAIDVLKEFWDAWPGGLEEIEAAITAAKNGPCEEVTKAADQVVAMMISALEVATKHPRAPSLWLDNACSALRALGTPMVDKVCAAQQETHDAVRAQERERCALLAEQYVSFTGAGYCDVNSPQYDPKRVHDYGRGASYVKQMIADTIRNPHAQPTVVADVSPPVDRQLLELLKEIMVCQEYYDSSAPKNGAEFTAMQQRYKDAWEKALTLIPR